MVKKLGTYSRFFWLTVILCAVYLGGSSGYLLSMEAALTIAVLATLGGALFLGFVGTLLSTPALGAGIIGSERQARIAVFSMWGTIAVFVVAGMAITFMAKGTILHYLTYALFEVLFGLIFGAEIGAMVWSIREPPKCQDCVII
jgi:hypothetical protein